MKKITAKIKQGYGLWVMGYGKLKLTWYVFLLLLFLTITYHLSPITSLAQQSGLITISPTTADLKVNDEQIVAVTLNSLSKISGFDLKFTTNGPLNIIDFENSLTYNTDFNPFNGRQVTEKIEGPSSRISYIFTAPENNLPQSVTLYLRVKGNSPGQAKLILEYNNSQVIDGSGKALPITPLAATYNLNQNQSSPAFINPSRVPETKYPESAAVVNIKVGLYGSGNNPSTKIKATAVAVGRIGEGPYETQLQEFYLIRDPGSPDQARGELQSGAASTFSGKLAFPDFKDGNKFSLMIKADKYLLRRICNPDASETKPGQYVCVTPNLTIRSGENNSFDFSKMSLLPGDLGLFDGYLNGYDLGIVRNNLNKSEPVNINLADLNYDNTVDGKDFEIISFVAANTNRRADQ